MACDIETIIKELEQLGSEITVKKNQDVFNTMVQKIKDSTKTSTAFYEGVDLDTLAQQFTDKELLDLYNPESGEIDIWSYTKDKPSKFDALSNLNTGNITVKKDMVFATVEGLYQYAKALFAGDKETAKKIRNLSVNPKVWNKASVTELEKDLTSGIAAQRLGQKVKGLDTGAWNKVSTEKLTKSMKLYYKQNLEAQELLLETGDSLLTHVKGKAPWNTEFPKILMQIRKDLQTGTKVRGGSVKVIPSYLNTTQYNFAIKAMERDFTDSNIDKVSNVNNHERQSAVVYGPVEYTYSLGGGRTGTHQAKVIPTWLQKVTAKVEKDLGKKEGYYNHILFNKFADNEGIGSHKDAEPVYVGIDGTIGSVATISIGDTKANHIIGGVGIKAEDNSLSEMSTGKLDHLVAKADGVRYSITFRHIPNSKLPIVETEAKVIPKQIKVVPSITAFSVVSQEILGEGLLTLGDIKIYLDNNIVMSIAELDTYIQKVNNESIIVPEINDQLIEEVLEEFNEEFKVTTGADSIYTSEDGYTKVKRNTKKSIETMSGQFWSALDFTKGNVNALQNYLKNKKGFKPLTKAQENVYIKFKDVGIDRINEVRENISSTFNQLTDTVQGVFDEKLNKKLQQIFKKLYPEIDLQYTTKDINPEGGLNQDRDSKTIMLQKEGNKVKGQANIEAKTVLINSLLQSQDTLPHEYAHHYIAMFRDTDIVQEGIKKWGTEEKLVQAIGEQVVTQKGDAYGWWSEFTQWIKNKFNNLSKKDKIELRNLLTDAFLTNRNLRKKLTPTDATVTKKDLGKTTKYEVTNSKGVKVSSVSVGNGTIAETLEDALEDDTDVWSGSTELLNREMTTINMVDTQQGYEGLGYANIALDQVLAEHPEDLLLEVLPMDDSTDSNALENWYASKGFIKVDGISGNDYTMMIRSTQQIVNNPTSYISPTTNKSTIGSKTANDLGVDVTTIVKDGYNMINKC